MTLKPGSIAVGMSTLRPGDRVLVTSAQGHIPFEGEVDDVAPLLDVAWIRDERSGERKIFLGAEADIHLVIPD